MPDREDVLTFQESFHLTRRALERNIERSVIDDVILAGKATQLFNGRIRYENDKFKVIVCPTSRRLITVFKKSMMTRQQFKKKFNNGIDRGERTAMRRRKARKRTRATGKRHGN